MKCDDDEQLDVGETYIDKDSKQEMIKYIPAKDIKNCYREYEHIISEIVDWNNELYKFSSKEFDELPHIFKETLRIFKKVKSEKEQEELDKIKSRK